MTDPTHIEVQKKQKRSFLERFKRKKSSSPISRETLFARIGLQQEKSAAPGKTSKQTPKGAAVRKFWVHLRSDVRTLFKRRTRKPAATPRRPLELKKPQTPIPPEPPKASTPPLAVPAKPKAFNTASKWTAAKRPHRLQRVKKRYALGLDIGTHAIKWAQFGEVNGQPELVELGMRFLDQPITTHPHSSLMQPLREWARDHKFKGPANVSLRLENAQLRNLKLPQLPEQELKQAIRWQIEQHLPEHTRYEDYCVDQLPLPLQSRAEERHHLVVSAQRILVDELVDLLKNAGLQPSALEIDPLAIQACIRRIYPERENETALLLHMGTHRASMSILVNGQLAFSRSNLTNGSLMTQAIAEKMHIPLSGAEQFKQQYGIDSLVDPKQLDDDSQPPPEHGVGQALASPMENLMVDFMHAFMGFSHHQSQSQVKRFNRIYLCGGGTQLPGLDRWLNKRLEVPVEHMNPFAGRKLPASTTLHAPIEQLYPQLVVAAGLALRELPKR